MQATVTLRDALINVCVLTYLDENSLAEGCGVHSDGY